MASRLGARVFAPALHRVVHRQAHGIARRQFSSHTDGASNSGSGDTPWKIGSALIFIPTIVYLLSPSAQSNSHKAHGAADHHAHAESTSKTPPKVGHIYECKPCVHVSMTLPFQSEATITDDEGTEVTVEEVKESITQAVTQDAPKEAAQAEADAAESPKSDDGAPGQTSEAETANEQSEKPDDGTPQSDAEGESSETPEQSTEASTPEVAVDEESK
ncbi:hypothetical protein V8E53_002495 [Lactarius tabidus]